MWQTYHSPTTLDEALTLLAAHGQDARIVAGGTDLLPEVSHGQRCPSVLIDLYRIPGFDEIRQAEGGTIWIGPQATHSQLASSPLIVERAFPLAQACLSVGSPQIRNQGTLVGNVATASPANDTITPLMALDARVSLRSRARGERTLALDAFYRGVRLTAMQPDELITGVTVEPLDGNQRGIFVKLGLRQAVNIAIINVAVVLAFDGERVTRARIALGSVAPTVVRACEAEAALAGQVLDAETIERAASLAVQAACPIDDVRASADYRRRMVRLLVQRALQALHDGTERAAWLVDAPCLWGGTDGRFPPRPQNGADFTGTGAQPVEAIVNGHPCRVTGAHRKTLLQMLREDLHLTGTKEGCSEGECGACTVLLDGIAVLSCLLPAARAHGAQITTIEGLGEQDDLTPLQQAFVDEGAVQCGYCTPGFVVAGEALLREQPVPSREAIRQALTGNLCRCTGYYKIIQAVERAAQMSAAAEAVLHD